MGLGPIEEDNDASGFAGPAGGALRFGTPPKMARRWVWLAAAAVALSAGCQRDRENKRHRRRAAEVHKPPPPIRVLHETVIKRGAEPHRLLRYQAAAGVEHIHRRAVTAEVSEIKNGEKQPLEKLPEVTTRFVLSWRSPGLLAVDVGEPSGDSAGDARVQTARFRALLAGKEATLELSERGLIGDVGGLGTREARRELAAALVDSIIPLPEVPVGVGARWRVIRAVPRANTAVKHRATFTIESIEGDRLVIAVEQLTIGERQPIDLPAASGAVSELLALRVSQAGELVIDLSAPTAVSGNLERADTIHLRTTRQQKTLRDYFAQSESRVELATEKKLPGSDAPGNVAP